MGHYLFNLSTGDRDEAVALLRAKRWRIADDERHRDDLAPGDLALIYLAPPAGEFIGRAEVATAVHEFGPPGAGADADAPGSGILLCDVERWDPAVPMANVVARVDPTGSNKRVRGNAAAGFDTGVVRITGEEYEAAVVASREYHATT